MGFVISSRDRLYNGPVEGYMSFQAEIVLYLIIGFILSGIVTVYSDTRTQARFNEVTTAAYLIVMFWPLMLPVFMVQGIAALKRERK